MGPRAEDQRLADEAAKAQDDLREDARRLAQVPYDPLEPPAWIKTRQRKVRVIRSV